MRSSDSYLWDYQTPTYEISRLLLMRLSDSYLWDYQTPTYEIIRLLLMRLSDFELNPGPRTPKYPCQICSKACRWGQRAIVCDNCDQWYHVNCLWMASQNNNYHPQTDVSWICCTCGLPNFSTSLFESLVVDTSNGFDSLSMSMNTTGNTTHPGYPLHTSSPKREQKSKQESPQLFSNYIIESAEYTC
jgi:hypothetical protein